MQSGRPARTPFGPAALHREADATLFDALCDTIDEDVELLEFDTDVNDEAFAEVVAEKLDAYMRAAGLACDAFRGRLRSVIDATLPPRSDGR